jgi:Na+/H+ antiporter NhaD/arsenite permease-like protein
MSTHALNISVLTLAAVFLLTAVRQVGRLRLQIWQIMLAGALAVLVTGQISVTAALGAINADVLLFLFGMFVVGQAMEESGYLAHLTYGFFRRARSLDSLVIMVLCGAGMLSAILMNDTLAVVGTPVMLLLARKHGMSSRPLLLALAFGITIGSVSSPIGNPQNLLIAIHGGLANPFVDFLLRLLVPSALNMLAAYWLLRMLYREDFHAVPLTHSQEPIRDHELAVLSRISLSIILVLIGVKIVTASLGAGDFLRLTHIALAACLPILAGSRRRWQIVRRIDWHTLVFFAAMFVLMESVWNSGFFQEVLRESDFDILSPGAVIAASIVLSQFISNVPLVALLLPALMHAGGGISALMALAAGSTIAGNLTILGAASNVIIIQSAERRKGGTITFLEFARAGVPLTILNGTLYWLFLKYL